jgi:hypothetical protein
MSYHFDVLVTEPLPLPDFLLLAEQCIDPSNPHSLGDVATALCRLAADPQLVLRHFNPRAEKQLIDKATASAQSIPLGSFKGCTLRANVWPTEHDLRDGRMVQTAFPYYLAQDQPTHLLSAGFYGPGYELDTYTYDAAAVVGYAGEPVRLEAPRNHVVAGGRAVLVPAGEVIVRRPPPALSITLDLLVPAPLPMGSEPRQFDLVKGELQERAGTMPAIRASIVALAALAGDGLIIELLQRLTREHGCPRTRLAAFEALARLQPADASDCWARAARDSAALVRHTAAQRIELPGAR